VIVVMEVLLGSGLAHRMHNRAQLPGVDGACAGGGGGVRGIRVYTSSSSDSSNRSPPRFWSRPQNA